MKTTMCVEGKHLICDGALRVDDWDKPTECQCVCHRIEYAIMLDHHISENDARVMASRITNSLRGEKWQIKHC